MKKLTLEEMYQQLAVKLENVRNEQSELEDECIRRIGVLEIDVKRLESEVRRLERKVEDCDSEISRLKR